MEYERDFFELGSSDSNVNMIEEKAKEIEESKNQIQRKWFQKRKYILISILESIIAQKANFPKYGDTM